METADYGEISSVLFERSAQSLEQKSINFESEDENALEIWNESCAEIQPSENQFSSDSAGFLRRPHRFWTHSTQHATPSPRISASPTVLLAHLAAMRSEVAVLKSRMHVRDSLLSAKSQETTLLKQKLSLLKPADPSATCVDCRII
jgi:hypothetical protein